MRCVLVMLASGSLGGGLVPSMEVPAMRAWLAVGEGFRTSLARLIWTPTEQRPTGGMRGVVWAGGQARVTSAGAVVSGRVDSKNSKNVFMVLRRIRWKFCNFLRTLSTVRCLSGLDTNPHACAACPVSGRYGTHTQICQPSPGPRPRA